MRHHPALHVLSLLSIALVSACDDARVDDGVFVGPAPRLPDPAPSAAPPDSGPPAAAGFMVGGRVATDEGAAIVGRPVVLVDARGKRTEILSDDGGAFWVDDVAPPYDLVVAGAPSGAPRAPTVYLGLTREDPFLELFERDGPSERAATELVRVAVKPPRCPTTCTVSVVTASETGQGASSASYGGSAPVVFEIEHAWRGPAIAPGETIDLHVLTADATRTAFTYARVRGIAAGSAEIADVGTLTPAPVASSAQLTLRAERRGVSDGWGAVLATWLEMPGGGSMSFTYDAAEEEVLQLPLVPGARMRATAWMQAPPLIERPYFRHAAQARSGLLPIAGGTLALALAGGPVPMRPVVDGTLSQRGRGFSWKNPPGAPPPLAEVTVTSVARGSLRFRAWTNQDEIRLGDLDRLGLSPLEPGDHELVVTATPGASVDAVVDPDGRARAARTDPALAGSSTTQGFRFRVTR